MISLSDHDPLLLLLFGLAVDALFGDLPAVFAHVPHPIVLAGRATVGRREAAAVGVTGTYTLVGHFGDVEQALARPAEGLSALARRLAGQWSRT